MTKLDKEIKKLMKTINKLKRIRVVPPKKRKNKAKKASAITSTEPQQKIEAE